MFKAAFPRATAEEEAFEKSYIKSLKQSDEEEVAGNIWIHPDAGKPLEFPLPMRYFNLAVFAQSNRRSQGGPCSRYTN